MFRQDCRDLYTCEVVMELMSSKHRANHYAAFCSRVDKMEIASFPYLCSSVGEDFRSQRERNQILNPNSCQLNRNIGSGILCPLFHCSLRGSPCKVTDDLRLVSSGLHSQRKEVLACRHLSRPLPNASCKQGGRWLIWGRTS